MGNQLQMKSIHSLTQQIPHITSKTHDTSYEIHKHNQLTNYLTNLLEKQTGSQLINLRVAYIADSPQCMQPEGWLLHSQQPASCSYSEPNQSSPCPQSHYLKNHFNITLPSMPRSSKWSFSLRFPHKNPVCTSALPHACYMPSPSHSSWLDHPHNIWWWIQIVYLITM